MANYDRLNLSCVASLYLIYPQQLSGVKVLFNTIKCLISEKNMTQIKFVYEAGL